MSKSLKNFITIQVQPFAPPSAPVAGVDVWRMGVQDALKRYTPRQLRLSFLAQRWDLPMDFAESAMTEVKNQESTFHASPAPLSSDASALTDRVWQQNFFAVVKALEYEAWLDENPSPGGQASPNPDLMQQCVYPLSVQGPS